VRFDNIFTYGDYSTFLIGQPGDSDSKVPANNIFVTNCVFENCMNTFMDVVGPAGNINVSDCLVGGSGYGPYRKGTNTALLLDLTNTSAVDEVSPLNWNTVDVETFATGVFFESANGYFADSTFDNVIIDGTTEAGCYWFQCTGENGKVSNLRIRGGWTASYVACAYFDQGGYDGNFFGLTIADGRFQATSPNIAIDLENGISNVAITGCEMFGSGAGVKISGSGASNVTITGNRLGPVYGTDFQNEIGVYIYPDAGGTVDGVTITGNQLGGNSTSGIAVDAHLSGAACSNIAIVGNSVGGYDAPNDAINFVGTVGPETGLVNVIVSDNPGFNPVGSVSAPTVPSSGTALRNPYTYAARVFVVGGTVSAIKLTAASGSSPATTGVTSGLITLGVNESITLEYSSAPTWSWFGL
jgi:hypothetical protein